MGSRNQRLQAFAAEGEETEGVSQPVDFIANDDTPTIYGATLKEICDLKDSVINRKHEEWAAAQKQVDELTEKLIVKEAKITELVEYGKQKNTEIGELKKDLGVARMLAKQAHASGIPQALERLPGGGVRLAVTLDIDSAGPYLSQAESAGEDPATFIQKQLEEALLAFANS